MKISNGIFEQIQNTESKQMTLKEVRDKFGRISQSQYKKLKKLFKAWKHH